MSDKNRLRLVVTTALIVLTAVAGAVAGLIVARDSGRETVETELIQPAFRAGEPGGDPYQVEVLGEEIGTELAPDRQWMWRLLDSVNRWRVDHGRLPITLNLIASKHADKHTKRMAMDQDLRHSGFGLMPGYRAQGEAVGRGGDPFIIMRAFMGSPEHKRIILLPEFNNVGISAVADRDGGWWVTLILGDAVPR